MCGLWLFGLWSFSPASFFFITICRIVRSRKQEPSSRAICIALQAGLPLFINRSSSSVALLDSKHCRFHQRRYFHLPNKTLFFICRPTLRSPTTHDSFTIAAPTLMKSICHLWIEREPPTITKIALIITLIIHKVVKEKHRRNGCKLAYSLHKWPI